MSIHPWQIAIRRYHRATATQARRPEVVARKWLGSESVRYQSRRGWYRVTARERVDHEAHAIRLALEEVPAAAEYVIVDDFALQAAPEQLDRLAAEWLRRYGKGHVTYEPRTTREALSRSGR